MAASSAQEAPPTEPAPPKLTFLYTAFADCDAAYNIGDGPKGTRVAIPIVGGTFAGPRVKGKILNLGADWGLRDAKGTFSADTRYHLQTDDGADIFIQTSGPAQPNGNLHLRLVFETGAEKYYWMNNIVAIDVLKRVGERPNGGFSLRIDTWHIESCSA